MLAQLFITGSLLGCAFAAPAASDPAKRSTCTKPLQRKAWHTLTSDEKTSYLNAELCLMSTPGTLGLRGGRTKYDEFQSVHVYQAGIAHFVGQFLPFHRLYVHAHEHALRTHCNYTGAQPYWDETVDAGAFSTSQTLKDFGGDGSGDNECISSASIFGTYLNPIGPGYRLRDHCIQRKVSNFASTAAAKDTVDGCLAKKTYLDLWNCVESGPHGAGHGGVGSGMTNPVSSPGDPIFYLHHTWLDKLWAVWQSQDKEVRVKEIGGNNTPGFDFSSGPRNGGGFPGGGTGGGQVPPGGGDDPGRFFGGPGFGTPADLVRPDDVPEPLVVGDNGNTTTLNQVLQMYGIVPNQTIAEVMDIVGGVLCYEYL
ncbi:hypothetical protein QBC43DRAFT_360360 [Cladorrhinum sp. PSN259]|nr:hypothetical protein QBC43DRAFT_360360 [Cladorrhinum sp. PSN259]